MKFYFLRYFSVTIFSLYNIFLTWSKGLSKNSCNELGVLGNTDRPRREPITVSWYSLPFDWSLGSHADIKIGAKCGLAENNVFKIQFFM